MKNKKSKPENKTAHPRQNPYKGLFYYEERDKELFYGRETEKRKLLRLVEHNLLTVVFGKSGIGKTSLLNAGLFPELRDKGFLPIRLRPDYSASAPPPREQIRNIITGELKRCGVHETGKEKGEAQSFEPGETLWEYFHRVDHGDDTGKSITPVLVFDQFEEIFTLGKSNPDINQLVDELYCLIEDQVPDALNEQLLRGERKFSYTGTGLNARVVISLREDYLPDLNSLKPRFPSIDRIMFRVIRLNGKQAREIIGMPGGLRDDSVINSILQVFQPDGEGGKIPDEKLEIEPSILSLLCFQLFEKQAVKLITRADQDKILTDFYNSVLDKFSGEVNKFVESKLLTEGGFRTPFFLEKDHKLRGPIEKLINERVVRKVYYDEKEHIEIIHDVLTPIIKEKRSRRVKKTKNVVITILSFALAVFILLALYAFYQENRAEKQLVNSLTTAAGLMEWRDNIIAIRIAEEAYKKASPNPPAHVMRVLSDIAASTLKYPFYNSNMEHSGEVVSAEFSPDSTQILTASKDGTAKRWDLKGNCLNTYRHNDSPVNSAVFSPDGTRVLTASRDGTAKQWDLNGNCLKIYRHNGSFVNSAVFSPDGKKIVTASSDRTAKLWNLNGEGLEIYEHSAIVNSAKFSPDGAKILTVSMDNTTTLWGLDGTLLQVYPHVSPVNSAEFAPDGNEILIASGDGTVNLWDLKGKRLKTYKYSYPVHFAVFSPEEKEIIMVSSGNTAKVLDSNGELTADLNKHLSIVYSAKFSRDGNKIVTASRDRTAKLWDFERQLLFNYKHTSPVNSAEFSPDGEEIVTASDDNTAKLWDLKGNLLKDFPHTDAVNTGTFSPDGHKILTASKDNAARLWDLKGKLLKEFRHTDAVKTAVFSPDGETILTASRDKTAKLWDLEGNLTADLNKHTGSVGSAVFSPDGTRILTASIDKTAKLWNLKGRLIVNLKHKSPVGIAIFSPDGNKIFTASMDNTVKLWDLNGRLTADLDTFKSPVVFAVFSPDGNKILTASMDNTAKLWDLEGNRLAVYNHSGWVHSAVFSPDGNWVLTASDDKTAGLWDLDGNLAAKLNKHTGTVRRAVFSPDGTRILTASDDGTAKLWYTPDAIYEWLKTANIPQLSREEKKELGIQ